ncbi:hypothetical protein RhiirA1_480927 [Rhizophagus irregularis]|uniref:Uncharacterized protein n=1 Tax=Rhizophagus irregularis TaxID=588596 RepID=A0A2N0QNR3_9GLOM|nr:hypothetical protein RhiirA1_480927 [Rhizophagus irregularis]
MAIEEYNRSIHNTVVLHIVLGDFNDTIDNKIDCSPSTEQLGLQFLIQLSQLGLYDVCQALYLNTELFTHENEIKIRINQALSQDQELIKSGSHMRLMLFQ